MFHLLSFLKRYLVMTRIINNQYLSPYVPRAGIIPISAWHCHFYKPLPHRNKQHLRHIISITHPISHALAARCILVITRHYDKQAAINSSAFLMHHDELFLHPELFQQRPNALF